MKLVIADGAAAGRVIDVAAGDVVVGRDEGCDLVLADDDQVSRRHCRFSQQPDGTVQVVDLGSSNGTFVDGQRITGETTLRGGEAIRVGRTLFRAERDPAATIAGTAGTIVAPARPATPPPPPAAAQPAPAAFSQPPGQGPPQPQPWWKSRWPILAIVGAVLVAGGVVGGVLAATGGDDEPETVAVTETETSESTVTVPVTVQVTAPDTGVMGDTAASTPTGDDLVARVPQELQATCNQLDPTAGFIGELGGAVAAVECKPQDGAIDAIYIQFDSAESMNAAYDAQVGEIPRDTGTCGTDAQGEGTYSFGDQQETTGRILCYEAEGEVYWWTSDATSILTVAAGPDLATVAAFWTGAGPLQ